ncbi:hypothetical protein ACXHMN_28210 [Rhizobium sp. LEGMi12c]
MPKSSNEAQIFDCIKINQLNLSRFLQDFQHSTSLFELLERGGGPPNVGVFGGVFINYRIIAAKDAAMNLYHFRCSLDAIIKQSKFVPSLISSASMQSVRDQLSLFDSKFPHTDTIRHGIAHAGELHETPIKINAAAQTKHRKAYGVETGPGGMLICALFERTFTIGKQRKIFSMQVDNSTISVLVSITHSINSIFASLPQQA